MTDSSAGPTAVATGMVWLEGVLTVRAELRGSAHGDSATAAPTMLVRDRHGRRSWELPTAVSPARRPQGPDDVMVVEARLDPRTAAAGNRLGPRVWDVVVRAGAPGAPGVIDLLAPEAPAPCLLSGTLACAYRNDRGGLSLDLSGRHSVLQEARPRLRDASVSATPAEDGSVQVQAVVPLDGVRTHGRTNIRGRAYLVAAPSLARRAVTRVLRRWDPAARPTGTAQLTATGQDVSLRVNVIAPAGRWPLELVLGGARATSPVLLDVSADGAVTTLVPAAEHVPPPTPLVSVIVPVHDAEAFIEEALRSALDQTLPAEQVEIIAVDDGSTDRSLEILRRLAKAHPTVRVIEQPASGSAARPRNTGLDTARGEYVFFLDADDKLAPFALERMTEAARAVDAQVVLGRMEGFGPRHRRLPRRAFHVSTLDADMVEHNLAWALGPTKLFERRHVADLRFDESLRRGEDQAFVTEAEITARRIVILADADYYLVRGHDGTAAQHMSRVRESIDAKLAKAVSVASVIERHTEPGDRRDHLMLRPFGGAGIEGIFRRDYLKAPADEQRAIVGRVVDAVGHLWTSGLRALVTPGARVLLDLVFRHEVDAVTDLVRHARGDLQTLPIVVTAEGLRLDVPARVAALVDPEDLATVVTKYAHQLTGIAVDGGSASLEGWVHADGTMPAPEGVDGVWVLRGSEVEHPAAVALDDTISRPQGTASTGFRVTVDPSTFPSRGIWDLYVAPRWGAHLAPRRRFGAARTPGVDTDAIAVGSLGQVLYGTTGHGNISLDNGRAVPPAPRVSLTGLQVDDDGRPEAVLQLAEPDPALRVYATPDPLGFRGARERLPLRRLHAATWAARLPVPYAPGEVALTLDVVHQGLRSRLALPKVDAVSTHELTVRAHAGRLTVARTAPTTQENPA